MSYNIIGKTELEYEFLFNLRDQTLLFLGCARRTTGMRERYWQHWTRWSTRLGRGWRRKRIEVCWGGIARPISGLESEFLPVVLRQFSHLTYQTCPRDGAHFRIDIGRLIKPSIVEILYRVSLTEGTSL